MLLYYFVFIAHVLHNGTRHPEYNGTYEHSCDSYCAWGTPLEVFHVLSLKLLKTNLKIQFAIEETEPLREAELFPQVTEQVNSGICIQI